MLIFKIYLKNNDKLDSLLRLIIMPTNYIINLDDTNIGKFVWADKKAFVVSRFFAAIYKKESARKLHFNFFIYFDLGKKYPKKINFSIEKIVLFTEKILFVFNRKYRFLTENIVF